MTVVGAANAAVEGAQQEFVSRVGEVVRHDGSGVCEVVDERFADIIHATTTKAF